MKYSQREWAQLLGIKEQEEAPEALQRARKPEKWMVWIYK